MVSLNEAGQVAASPYEDSFGPELQSMDRQVKRASQLYSEISGSLDSAGEAKALRAFADMISSQIEIPFGNVAQAGLSEDFGAGDLTVVGSLAGGGDLGNVDLIYVPEPSTVALPRPSLECSDRGT